MSVPYYPGSLYTPNLGLALYSVDSIIAENFVILDTAYGAGSSIFVNGTLVESPNLSSTTPAAPGGQELVTFQYDSNGNISAYVPIPAAGGVTSFTGDSVVYNNAASTGAVSLSLITQTKNTVLAGPTTGANATPTFRALVSGDIPNNAANTTGTAANLSGTPALPNGTTATTQVATDATTLIATDAFVQNAIDAAAPLLGIPWFNLIDALDYNQVVPWYNNGSPFAIDTGISRISAGVLGIGTGAQGSVAGGLELKTLQILDSAANADLLLKNTTAATALTTNASPLLELAVFYDNGGVFTGLDTWSVGSSIAAGSNGASTLTFAHSGSTGIAAISIPETTGKATLQLGGTVTNGIGAGSASTNLGLYAGADLQFYFGGTEGAFMALGSGSVGMQFSSSGTNGAFTLGGGLSTGTNLAEVNLGGQSTGAISATSGTNAGVSISNTGGLSWSWAPTTGTGSFIGLYVNPTINQTGGTGNYTGLGVYPYVEAVAGTTPYLIAAGTASASALTATLTNKFTVDPSGNAEFAGSIVAASEAIASQIAGTLGTQLATPNAPTITFVGSTSGSPTWSYKLVAYDQFGFETLPSTAGTITSSNTTLSSSNYNVITAPSTLPLGCVGWNVYRTAVATSPTTTGIIGQITTASGTLNDTALPGDGSTVPLWNFTGLITSAASAGAGSCGLLTPFLEAALITADTTTVFVGNSTVNQLKAIQCYCARTVTANRMTLDVVQNDAGATANIAIYRGDGGRKLFDVNVSVASTGIVTSTSTGVTGFSFPFTFYAGQTYYIVSSASNASSSAYGVTMNGYATIQQNLIGAVHVRYGYCANLASGGVSPATLGTITYQSAGSFPVACYWEP